MLDRISLQCKLDAANKDAGFATTEVTALAVVTNRNRATAVVTLTGPKLRIEASHAESVAAILDSSLTDDLEHRLRTIPGVSIIRRPDD